MAGLDDLVLPGAAGNGGGELQVQVFETRTFASFGFEVGPEKPGENGLPVRDIMFATRQGTVYVFPMDAIGLAQLRAKIDRPS